MSNMSQELEIYLKAIASSLGKEDEETFLSFYDFAKSQLKTEAEHQALMFGTLALLADHCKFPLRKAYYTFKFKRALKRIKSA